jgi:hypothetical protein
VADTDTNANETQTGASDNTAKPAEKTYTKTEHTLKIKEVETALTRERDALAAKLAEYEAEKEQERVAKLSATQRAEEERKRAEKATAEKIAALESKAMQERAKRHDVLRQGRAASIASTFATQLWTADLLPHVESAIASRLVVVDDGKGGESVLVRMGAEGDNEPIETALPKLREDPSLRGFIKINGGSGSQHGGGAGGSQPKPASLVEAIEAEAAKRRNR